MTLTLKPELERYVRDQIESGRFSSPTEVIEAALGRLMLEPPASDAPASDGALRAAALEARELYEPGGELNEWTSLDTEEFLDDTTGHAGNAVER